MHGVSPMFESLAEYPRWFVVACLTVVAAASIWLTIKILKWSLYLLLTLIVIVGGGTALWLLFH